MRRTAAPTIWLYPTASRSADRLGSGLLAAPVSVSSLALAPGERADLIVDFSAASGQTILLKNDRSR
jgi:hypothetical protein